MPGDSLITLTSSKWVEYDEPLYINNVNVLTEIIKQPSERSVDDLDDVAFKILNHDNLPMAVVGEPALKPFGTTTNKLKPNGIVFPTRRPPTNLDDNKAKSNGHINSIEFNNNSINSQLSQSHGQLNHCNSANFKLKHDTNIVNSSKTFTKSLDAKLRKLQLRDDAKSKKSSASSDIPKRPLFMTTVKRGQFIQPPPELASLFGLRIDDQFAKNEKKVYTYSSRPRVLNKTNDALRIDGGSFKNVHRSRCDAAAKAAAVVASSIAGIGSDGSKDINSNFTSEYSHKKYSDAPPPYANLMYERRVVRGSTYAMHPMPTMGDGESAAARAAEARRRAMARRKAKDQQMRGAQLRLASPPPVQGRRHENVQTDQYLEELLNNPPVEDMCTQTDLFLDRPVSPFYVPAKTGADVSTQIYPGDLFDFDMEVQPIIEVLVGKTIEQALIEVLEEEELAALREQQRRFLELRASETAEAQRLEEREKRLQTEKAKRMAEYEEGLRLQMEMEERIAAAVLTQGYMADLLPSVLEGLEADGFLVDSIRQDLDDNFLPWLMREVTHELKDMVSSRDVLTDIIREILENRAEIYKALNQETKEPESEEEMPTLTEDLALKEHLMLKAEMEQEVDQSPPPETK